MDPLYFLVLLAAICCMIASFRVRSVYNKYAKVISLSGMTGATAARAILEHNGIHDVTISMVQGTLTDHYDPRNKVVALSETTYGSGSVAAIGVAAHECGHVCQHHYGYSPLNIRSALLPVANIGSRFGVYIVLIGLLLNTLPISGLIMDIGIILYSAAVFFQIVTLPIEFDASRRALVMLDEYGILTAEELPYSRKVLSAAALTYVASAAASLLQLIRLLALRGNRR